MSRSSWLRPLVLSGALCWALADLGAGEHPPEGLPHEQVTLRDGRRLSGYYDPVMAILWLDGPYRARLRLRHGDVIRRTPLAETAVPTMTVSANAGGARQLTIRLREQQLAEFDRRRQETGESIRLLTTTLTGLETLHADIGRTLGDQPDPVTNAALMSQQQQIRLQIGEIRRKLTLLDDHLKTLERRREQAAQVLARARSASAAATDAALADPLIEMRLQALEDEVRALRADNQDLRRQLERLRPSAPEAPTQQPIPPAETPATDDATSERVARR